ncbi:hypothetical protein EP7_005478 [Isosphaeraceae bacterium EP7]
MRAFWMAAALLGFGSGASADDAWTYRLEMGPPPAPFVRDGSTDAAIEASAVEPLGDGLHALVAHDKEASLRLMTIADGAQGEPLASPRFLAAAGPSPKWEGMARDSEGRIYAIGSHGGKTEAERLAHSVLIRFRVADLAGRPAIDDASVETLAVAGSIAGALEAEGLAPAALAKRKVEGLAIRERGARRELVIGLREPDDRVRAVAADLASGVAEPALRPLFRFEPGAREGVRCQLTSLEDVPALGGFLVLTATEDEANAFHGNTLWFVADGRAEGAEELARFEPGLKAEGLAVLEVQEDAGRIKVRLLITYDNDGHTTGQPSRFQAPTLVREPR